MSPAVEEYTKKLFQRYYSQASQDRCLRISLGESRRTRNKGLRWGVVYGVRRQYNVSVSWSPGDSELVGGEFSEIGANEYSGKPGLAFKHLGHTLSWKKV